MEWYLLLALFAIVAAYLIGRYNHESEGETADMVGMANVKEPLIFEQCAPTRESKQVTIQQAARAVELLKLYGNKHLAAGIFPYGDVHLWIHDSDTANKVADFNQWQFNNMTRRVDLITAFRNTKNGNAKTQEELLEAAKMWADLGENEN